MNRCVTKLNFLMLIRRQLLSVFPTARKVPVSVSDLAPLSDMDDNEPCDVPETTTANRTSDTETVQSETGQNGHAGHDTTDTNQTVDLHDQPAPSLRR